MDNDLWTTYQEKIRRAKSRETNNLHSHFVTTKEKIGDFQVVPITLERFALLSIDEVWNSADPSIPVLRALWILSPDFSTDPIKAKIFIEENRLIKWKDYQKEIRDYIDDAFLLAPASSKKEENTSSREWISSVVDTFASEYGWEESTILQTPLPRLFLYLRRIRERITGNPVKFNSEADRLQAEFMQRMNERN